MHSEAGTLARAVALAIDEGTTRDVARWELCKQICDDLNACYRPESIPAQPMMLRTYCTATLIEALENNEALAVTFGAYRAQVTDVEARNSRRLEMVAFCKHELEAMRPRAVHQPELIDHMLQRLFFFLRGAWELEIPEDSRTVRLWCQRVTRAYEVLPREWRAL